MSEQREVFHFGDVEDDHIVGDANCGVCWSADAAPHDCGTPGCLEHTQFGDYSSYDSFWLYRVGDLCKVAT